MVVEAKALTEIPRDSIPLRSKQMIDIDPAAVTRIEVATQARHLRDGKGNDRLAAHPAEEGKGRRRVDSVIRDAT